MKHEARVFDILHETLPLKVSVTPPCFLPGGLPLSCASAGSFPCFSADCLSGETGVKK